jgi:hypothetical protein
MFGELPFAHRALQHRQREPVDLEEHDPGSVRLDPVFGASRDAVDHAQRVQVVVVDAEQHAERDARGRSDEHDAERSPEAVHVEVAARDRVGGEQHQGVEDEHEQEADERHQRQAQCRDDRQQQRVEHADHGCCGERAPEIVHRGAGDHRRADDERDRREQPRDEHVQHADARARRTPDRRLAVYVRACRHLGSDAIARVNSRRGRLGDHLRTRNRRRDACARGRHLRVRPLGEPRRARRGADPARAAPSAARPLAARGPAPEDRLRRREVARRARGQGAAEATDEAIYLGIAVRNVGPGIAVLHAWHFYPTRRGDDDPRARLDDFTRLTRDIYIAPGDIGFWQGAFRDPAAPGFAEARAAIEARAEVVAIDVLYGDQDGGQRMVSRFGLLPRDDGGWNATVSRHWSVDGVDPR